MLLADYKIDDVISVEHGGNRRTGTVTAIGNDSVTYDYQTGVGAFSAGWPVELLQCAPFDVRAYREAIYIVRADAANGTRCPNLSQLELAAMVGTTDRTVQRWESRAVAVPDWVARYLRELDPKAPTQNEAALAQLAEEMAPGFKVERIGPDRWLLWVGEVVDGRHVTTEGLYLFADGYRAGLSAAKG